MYLYATAKEAAARTVFMVWLRACLSHFIALNTCGFFMGTVSECNTLHVPHVAEIRSYKKKYS
jgi:hypothetical protein